MVKTIHQFTPSMEIGDSVSNSVLYIQKMLKKLGFISEIYVARGDLNIDFKHNIHHITEYKTDKNQLLFYHHSIGHNSHDMIMNFEDKKVIVYHNITPPHFFKHNPHIQELCEQGRRQLENGAKYFIASIGDSDYNCKELRYYGYPNPLTLTLLLDLDKQIKYKPNQKLIQKYHDLYNIVFIGRVVQNKMQHQLIDLAYALKRKGVKNFKIHIVGGASEPKYMEFLQQYVKDMDMLVEVTITGKVTNEDLASYYNMADLYISISEHEGFGMPLIEAMKYDIPVLAYNAGGIATTVPKDALLEKKAPSFIADEIIKLRDDPYFRTNLLKQQKEKLESFSNENTIKKLIKFLDSLNIKTKKIKDVKSASKRTLNYQVEGPFDSSYSLAIVNKNIALSLDAKLYSTEGYGDFEPDLQNVTPEVKALALKELDSVDVTVRNLYPPRTNNMKGYHKIIGPYGWEESKFPQQYVEWFNTKLTMIFTMSDYVKNTLRANGVYVPMLTTGLVVEDILSVDAVGFEYKLPTAFKILHISSAFPRKGLKLLLKAFDELDVDISMVIKTFPNPHNNTIDELKSYGYSIEITYEDGVYLYKKENKEILFINKDISQEQIKYLYENTDVLVAPSFGEGFGLPMAEAMLLELPVITTGYGGQTDFCTSQSSWLLDFDFEYTSTHMNLANSIWAVPKVASIKENILNVKNHLDKQKIKFAKDYILDNHSSKKVAKTIKEAIQSYPLQKTKKNIALFSTYNTKCGIAQYSKYLISTFEKEVTILANKTDAILEDDTKNIIRCWRDSRDTQEIEQLKQTIKEEKITVLIIQYNFSFIPLKLLAELLVFCDELSIQTHLFLHSTKDVVTDVYTDSFVQIKKELQSTKIYVHSLKDMNYLKDYDIYKNSILFTHGFNYTTDLLKITKKTTTPTLATFGFLLPQKGVFKLVDVAEELHAQGIKVNLLLLTSIHPASVSHQLKIQLEDKIKKSKISSYITFNTDFLDEDVILEKLSDVDKILYLYDTTQESSSAAVRMGLLAQKEVITTPLAIFDDVKSIVTQTKDNTIHEIIKTIKTSLKDDYDTKKHKSFLITNSFKNISKTFYNTI